MKELTLRQQAIAKVLPYCEILADVGCDHGYIGAYAIKKGIAKTVYFCDISDKSLEKARILCDKLGIEDNISFYCRDGLGDIVADCVVIAGMGGLEIISILNNAQHLPNKLVLQPMRNQADVRRFLLQKGYKFDSDRMFYDGKFYDLMVLSLSQIKSQLTDEEISFGKDNVNVYNADFIWYADIEIKKLKQILQRHEVEGVRKRLNTLLSIKSRFNGGMQCNRNF